LIGPKTVECVPRQNNDAKSSGMLCSHSPQAPIAMIAISATLTHRAMAALSTRSASVPDAPENRKKGAMNKPPAIIVTDAASRPASVASR